MEALFYNKLNDNVIECTLCPHYCKIRLNHFGICKSRQNNNGILEATAYGRICSVAVDPIEKKPLYHFLPGTKTYSIASPGCNFICNNCQNDGISQHSITDINTTYISPEEAVQQASIFGSISYTYTEPLIFFEYVYDTAKLARSKEIKNIIVSNGYINEEPLKMLCKYLDAANIDLKFFDEKRHKSMTGGKLEHVLNTLKILKENDVWIEITNLLIPDLSDDPNMILKMCQWLVENGFSDNPLHFSRFFPRYKMIEGFDYTKVETLEMAKNIALGAGMKYVYLGNI